MKLENPASWSNAKRARVFMHMLGCVAKKYGTNGVLSLSETELDQDICVGFDKDEGGDFLVVLDTDAESAPTTTTPKPSGYCDGVTKCWTSANYGTCDCF